MSPLRDAHRHGTRRRVLIAAAVLAAAAAVTLLVVALVGGGTRPTAARPELQRELDAAVRGPGRIAPGAAAYVSGPHGTWSGAAGVADLRSGAPMTADARVRLESLSKVWTATLILQLAHERRLRLSDTVQRWLPGVLPYGDRITIAELLAHRSGLVDNNDIAHDPLRYLANVRDPRARARFRRVGLRTAREPAAEFSPWLWIRLAAWQPLRSTPGAAYHYSNIGYEILGVVAQRAAGRPLGELYAERFFRPLRLASAAYDPQGPISGPHARAYVLARGRRPVDATDWHGGIGAEGGIVANARDEATFMTSLMRGRLLPPLVAASMRAGGFWPRAADVPCGSAYGHSGAGDGFKTNVWVSSDGGRVAVLVLNGRSGDRGDDRAGAIVTRLFCAA